MKAFRIPALFALAALALPLAARAHDESHHHGTPAPAAQAPGNARVTVVDAALVDQDGRSVRLRRDVMGDRIVVLDFIYTTCTTICPVLSAAMAEVQTRLGERSGREVVLVSVSVDPARDTPPLLKAYAKKHGVGPGWTMLTGAPPVVADVLKGFGAYVADPTQHPPMVLVGDGRSGTWTRFLGLPNPAQVVAKVDELQGARTHAHSPAKEH